MHGVYIGDNEALHGKTALLRDSVDSKKFLVQFDDTNSGFGFGWHHFDKADFKLDTSMLEVQ